MHILLTRPINESIKTKIILTKLGYKVTIDPLLKIIFSKNNKNYKNIYCYIITSKNGLLALSKITKNRSIPIYCIGLATAKFAKQKKFKKVFFADGTGKNLYKIVCKMAKKKKILHVSGKDITLDIAKKLKNSGYDAKRIIAYKTLQAQNFRNKTILNLSKKKIDLVLFFSKKTAKTYIKLSRKANINNKLKEVHSLCLSKNIANVFPRNYWKKMYTSAHPNLLSLIDTIRKIN